MSSWCQVGIQGTQMEGRSHFLEQSPAHGKTPADGLTVCKALEPLATPGLCLNQPCRAAVDASSHRQGVALVEKSCAVWRAGWNGQVTRARASATPDPASTKGQVSQMDTPGTALGVPSLGVSECL